jgi:hypothetical protein
MILINLNWRYYYYFDMTETYLEVWISSLCKNASVARCRVPLLLLLLLWNIIYSSLPQSVSRSQTHTKQLSLSLSLSLSRVSSHWTRGSSRIQIQGAQRRRDLSASFSSSRRFECRGVNLFFVAVNIISSLPPTESRMRWNRLFMV